MSKKLARDGEEIIDLEFSKSQPDQLLVATEVELILWSISLGEVLFRFKTLYDVHTASLYGV